MSTIELSDDAQRQLQAISEILKRSPESAINFLYTLLLDGEVSREEGALCVYLHLSSTEHKDLNRLRHATGTYNTTQALKNALSVAHTLHREGPFSGLIPAVYNAKARQTILFPNLFDFSPSTQPKG